MTRGEGQGEDEWVRRGRCRFRLKVFDHVQDGAMVWCIQQLAGDRGWNQAVLAERCLGSRTSIGGDCRRFARCKAGPLLEPIGQLFQFRAKPSTE